MRKTAQLTDKTGFRRDIAIMLMSAPFAVLAACGGDSSSENDAGACPAGQVLRYESAGCGTAARPVCGSPVQDACFRAVCSCKGATISRCDYAPEPFSSFGPCNDSGADGSRDLALDIAPFSPADAPLDRRTDLGADTGADTTDTTIDGEGSASDASVDTSIDLASDTGIDGGNGAGLDGAYDAGTCPAGQVLRYQSPGCDSEAKPVCGSRDQDACFRAVCSCKGVTISRCDYATEPFAFYGPCNDGSTD